MVDHKHTTSGEKNGSSDGNRESTVEGTATQTLQHVNPPSLSVQTSPTSHVSLGQAGQNSPDSPQTGSASQSSAAKESPKPRPPPKDNADSAGSRIPRGIGLKHSIPVAVKRRSAEQLSVALQGKQSGPSPSGGRVTEKPRGPRPKPSTEQTSLVIPDPGNAGDQASDPRPASVSSSSASSWDFGDGDELERPITVFTGEYRTRVLPIPGNQAAGPTLRIAASADDIIMGSPSRESPNYAVTQRTNPTRVKYLDKLLPSTPKDSGSLKGDIPLLDSNKSEGSSQKDTPVTRNFCRPQLSLDSLPKRDISNKEMSISRKPVKGSSLGRLFSPSLKSLQSDTEPLVPKIPDQYCSDQETGLHQAPSKVVQPETPEKPASEAKDTPLSAEANITTTPATVIRTGVVQSHPPRTSSLRAISDFPNDSATKLPRKPATNLKRNVTFNDIVPLGTRKEQITPDGDRPRLPESRSNHILDSFRNIFRSRTGVAEKERVKKEGEAPELTNENQTPQSGQGHTDPETSVKAKPKHPRLPSGVSWNKSSRNPKTADVPPTTPTPSVPRLLAPSNRHTESNTPSFARPTKSTRTKAASGLRSPSSITPDIHPRRTHIRTASTGSPQRLALGPRRATSNLLAFSAQKRSNQPPVPEKTAVASSESTDSLPKNLEAARNRLEMLCKKVGEATNPLERDRHIRLALTLQQQLGDYQSIEKVALEAEAAAKIKQLERKAAEDCLNTTLAEAHAQLDQD
ncbi:uncharacterized protein BJX67DRAFT_376734 [Aspergillus lucknowensis]|uniref:Uncharacterized protein n=1 Tax=Aspergillus lucknowensis TaxID=176173 RepID=A0ABR4M5K7_9EURO